MLAFALIVVFAGTVLATDSRGFRALPLAHWTLSDSVHYNTGAVKFQTKGPVELVTTTVTIDPLGSSGWHSHPGVVLVTVKSGSVVVYAADCSSKVYGPGTAFTESGDEPGLVRNESASITEVSNVTYIVPKGTTVFRIGKGNPGCPQD